MSISLRDEIYMQAAEDMADSLGGWINELMNEIKTVHHEEKTEKSEKEIG